MRWFLVWITAWGLRRGLTHEEIHAAIEDAFPWRDEPWRVALIADAMARNRRKVMKSIA